jgi:hypothetical protein
MALSCLVVLSGLVLSCRRALPIVPTYRTTPWTSKPTVQTHGPWHRRRNVRPPVERPTSVPHTTVMVALCCDKLHRTTLDRPMLARHGSLPSWCPRVLNVRRSPAPLNCKHAMQLSLCRVFTRVRIRPGAPNAVGGPPGCARPSTYHKIARLPFCMAQTVARKLPCHWASLVAG